MTAVDQTFQAPDSIQAGWVTFRFKNESEMTHFALVERPTSWDTQPTGLEVPAPATFLGGVNEMPVGSTGYLTVDLEPGQYAWIAEVPKPMEKGMLKSFTVLGGVQEE